MHLRAVIFQVELLGVESAQRRLEFGLGVEAAKAEADLAGGVGRDGASCVGHDWEEPVREVVHLFDQFEVQPDALA